MLGAAFRRRGLYAATAPALLLSATAALFPAVGRSAQRLPAARPRHTSRRYARRLWHRRAAAGGSGCGLVGGVPVLGGALLPGTLSLGWRLSRWRSPLTPPLSPTACLSARSTPARRSSRCTRTFTRCLQQPTLLAARRSLMCLFPARAPRTAMRSWPSPMRSPLHSRHRGCTLSTVAPSQSKLQRHAWRAAPYHHLLLHPRPRPLRPSSGRRARRCCVRRCRARRCRRARRCHARRRCRPPSRLSCRRYPPCSARSSWCTSCSRSAHPLRKPREREAPAVVGDVCEPSQGSSTNTSVTHILPTEHRHTFGLVLPLACGLNLLIVVCRRAHPDG